MTDDPEVLVLGGGSGGYACAFRAAQLGHQVTLIEADKLGGTCLHQGCIPTKALIQAGEVVDTIRHAGALGINATLHDIDVNAMHRFKDGVVDRLHRGLEGLFRHHNVEVVHGRGRYVGGTTVEVDGRTISGRHLVLATGSQARTLPDASIGGRVITSDEALTLAFLPRHAIVLGGGVIGVEFASLWASLGAEVTIIEALPRLLPTDDEWTSRQLTRALRKRGLTIKTDTRASSTETSGDSVRVTTDTGESITGDVLLIAVGRGPRTAVGLSDNGIQLDANGFVCVDENLATNEPNVYAVGDIVAGPQLAHRGLAQGIFVAEIIAGLPSTLAPDTSVPRVTYSHPETAAVGLTETVAREQYGDISTTVYDLTGNGKSQILDTRGGIKLIRAGRDSGPVVGIHMVGDRVSELIGEAQLIVGWAAHPEDVAPLIHAHPTLAESLGEAHMALAGKAFHSHA